MKKDIHANGKQKRAGMAILNIRQKFLSKNLLQQSKGKNSSTITFRDFNHHFQ